jgi:hypothetical protein
MKKHLSKVLALLPLVLMGAGVWYFVQVRMGGDEGGGPAAWLKALSGRPGAAAPGASTPAPQAPVPVAPGVAAARLPPAYDPRVAMDIQGSPAFKGQVLSALKLIWAADRGTFLFVKNNLSVIRSQNMTGFYMDHGQTVAAISDANAFRSVTWCAGIIAHQAWHAAYSLSKNKNKALPPPPPPGQKADLRVDANPVRVDYHGMDSLLDIEARAFAFQLDVLRKVGAPRSETRPLLRRQPEDFSLAHDGDYNINP